jgi:SpoVK/Ycf46/Vps4 family AAA+-type ATPase
MVAMEEADAAAGDTGACELRPLRASDFAAARTRVGASIVRGVAVEPAPLTWDDIGGLEDVKRRLRQAVEWPLQHADAFARLGLRPPRGVLLHGPPGCSKTCLARAAAHASGATLIPLSGAQLFSMYLGEGERTLQRAFARARAAAPSIILLDEADGVGARRPEGGADGGGGSGAEERLLCTLLAELDGIAPQSGVLLIAATNRPGALDAALLRPGRLDVHLFVPPPDAEGRVAALRIHTRRMRLAADVDLRSLADAAAGASGAELAAVCAEAALTALREDAGAQAVQHRHFAAALAASPPALSPEQLAAYAAFGTRAAG